MKMSWKCVVLSFLILIIQSVLGDSGTDYNDVNPDGTYAFRHSNDDIGNYYHTASKTSDQIVRGRYGSRNSANGRVEETVYTAGPRGFRARGPQIHRKMDLSQYPVGPKGSPDDPLADPYDDPSYAFDFKTPEYERNENADSNGRINGLYSYLDDVGERHTVRYAAGAGTGYEVLNAVPDSPASVAYSAPLYKAPAWTRGKMSVRRGPNGQYDFILSAPDHRRSETSGPDGIVRGSYSYLDDKGVQRTVQYIAGAGIGYRVVQNTIGPGTHLNPRPALPEFGVRDYQSNDLDEGGYARPAAPGQVRPGTTISSSDVGSSRPIGRPGRPSRPNRPISGRPDTGNRRDQLGLIDRTDNNISNEDENSQLSPVSRDKVSQGGGGVGGGSRYPNRRINNRPSSGTRGEGNELNGDRGGYKYPGGRKPDRGRPQSGSGSSSGHRNTSGGGNSRPGIGGNDRDEDHSNEYSGSSNSGSGYQYDKGGTISSTAGPTGNDGGGYRYPVGPPVNPNRVGNRLNTGSYMKHNSGGGSNSNIYNDNDYNRVPLVSADHRLINTDRDRDWSLKSRDSTVIKNVGKWYINLPPGQAVRAHVQNIDILPLGGRIQSPSDALRQDELHN